VRKPNLVGPNVSSSSHMCRNRALREGSSNSNSALTRASSVSTRHFIWSLYSDFAIYVKTRQIEAATVTPVRVPNPRYTFYYTVGFGSCNPLILLMKIGAIFIIIRRSGVRKEPKASSVKANFAKQSYAGANPGIATTKTWWVLDRWFTEPTDHIIKTFGPNGFSSS
jgi:hypothetical protein